MQPAPGTHTQVMQEHLTSYDSVIYPSYTHPQTHPDRLAVIGALFGLRPAAPDHCRVLELGCGNGSNLVPMAWGLPQSQFVGVDLAARPIAHGQAMIRDLGLTNIRLVHCNLNEISTEWGKFDYLIAHGLYSWVPADAQENLLATCRGLLASQGIAYVSYNAFPGCHLRNMLREMMLFHVRGFDSPQERVNQALALARFLAAAQETRDEYRLWMKAELDNILEHEDGHLYHDELAEVCEPLYFTQFMERAAGHGLQYVGEADYYEMSDHIFSDSTRQTLGQLARNRILREQYLDFLKCRRFRQTLLCHREATLQLEPQAETVASFLVSSAAACVNGAADMRPGVKCSFATAKGGRFETDYALGKAALAALEPAWPASLSFDELFRQAKAGLEQEGGTGIDDEPSREQLCGFLLQLYSAGIAEFHTLQPPAIRNLSERPVANPVARWQVQHGDFVTSLFHIAVRVEDDIGRSLLTWLDGSHDRPALLEKLWQLLKSKNALVFPEGSEIAARRNLEHELERNLEKLAKLGLLVA